MFSFGLLLILDSPWVSFDFHWISALAHGFPFWVSILLWFSFGRSMFLGLPLNFLWFLIYCLDSHWNLDSHVVFFGFSISCGFPLIFMGFLVYLLVFPCMLESLSIFFGIWNSHLVSFDFPWVPDLHFGCSLDFRFSFVFLWIWGVPLVSFASPWTSDLPFGFSLDFRFSFGFLRI